MNADITLFDEVDSTNTVLMKMACEGAKEGRCVVSSAQTSGQGRSGRTFFSPAGNLYMSLLLRPENKNVVPYITVMAGVAAVEAVKERFGVKCGIKWVNDIYLNGKKAGGIVAKASGDDKNAYIILGMGINVYEAREVPEQIKDVYTSLFGKYREGIDEKCDLLGVSSSIIRHFSYYYDNVLTKEAIERYRKYCCVIGQEVEYTSGAETFTATVSGISDDGGIMLVTDSGIRCYHDGEIRIRQLCKP